MPNDCKQARSHVERQGKRVEGKRKPGLSPSGTVQMQDLDSS